MKNLLIAATLFITSIAFSQETKDTTAGVLEFETEVIDYGKIKQNDDGNRSFKFKNTGNSPITIANVKGSCGCTVATKPNKPILPGETAEIGIKYATNRVGGFSKTVTITSDASMQRKVLRIKGIVLKSSESNSKTLSATR
ncbi:MAG: hypothetical protein ACI8ZX_002091 [Planctomycetota bacterium]|jgi:hypothetical protein|tara:strand:+ start:310 stop:732 length:423 start_codon:yes stop_codon:yes gene_type:complete